MKNMSFNEFIDLCVRFRDENPGSGNANVLIENIDAPGCIQEMVYPQPNCLEVIRNFDGGISGVSIGAGEI